MRRTISLGLPGSPVALSSFAALGFRRAAWARPRMVADLLAPPSIGPATAERCRADLLTLVPESLRKERGRTGA